MPLILGANSLAGGYQVKNSLRFNSGSTDYLTKSTASPTLNTKGTFSCWHKRSNLGGSQTLYSGGTNVNVQSGTKDMRVYIGTDYLEFYQDDYNVTGNNTVRFANNLLRDVSAWYHIVVAVDTGQSTNADKVKAYINGTQLTASTVSLTESFTNIYFNTSGLYQIIGTYNYDVSVNRLDGYMSEVYFIDGQQLTPSSFGETDEDSGIWKPKAYTGTFGTNGFYLDFEDSANLGNDMSGNNNDFTVNNLTSIDQTTDTPTNNFCTMNPLYKWTYNLTLTEGNLSCSGTQNQWQGAIGSIGISKGKWYYEVKFTSATNIGDFYIGFGGLDNFVLGSPAFRNAVAFYNFDGGEVNVADTSNTAVTTADYGTFANGDIMGVALDYDNELITIYKNGSAIVTNFDYGATSYPSTITDGKTISPVAGHYGSGSISFNFGNPPFTIASGNADANGYGNFEYAVPSGYYALCTKNLAQFG